MSFGLSADTEKSVMVPGDVTVAWVDKQTLQGYAIDYFLNAKSQCSGRRGACPDRRIQVFSKERTEIDEPKSSKRIYFDS